MDQKEMDRRLGGAIVKAGLASKEQVEDCLAIRSRLIAAGAAAKSLGDILLQKGFVTKDAAVEIAKLAEKQKAQEFSEAGPTTRRTKDEAAAKPAKAEAPAKADGPGAGLKIPGYEILDLLGKGGMGSVYKARQKSLDRIVALKVLSPDVAKDETYLKRFTTEARALARLNHENIIAGIDVGEANGYRYFAMEYVEGESLATTIERDGALPEKRAVTICMQVARALVHADKNGLVHRDVKPQNIMIGRNDVAKLCDLGLAMTADERKEARERGQSIGTPHYISPEQARGEHHVDIRSDIYSLGATLYHAVTGETPFTGTSPMVLMTKHLTEEPVPPKKKVSRISKPVSDLVLKMMAKEKERRYQTPTELLEDMERCLAGRQIEGSSGRSGKAAPKEEREAPAPPRSSGKSKAARPARAAAKPARRTSSGEDDGDGEGDDEVEDEAPRSRRPKKMPGNVMALISVFVLLVVGGIAAVIFIAANNQEPPPPPPPSQEVEDAARQSFENFRNAFAKKDIDKYAAINGYHQVIDKFPRTQGAKDAETEIHRVDKLALNPDAAAEATPDEDAPKRAPLGAKDAAPAKDAGAEGGGN